jgi:predicted ATP-dependent protease
VRITATVRVGEGDVIDIEREAELGGAIHSKGVMILSAFLGARFARNVPLSLSASLVFEQSYGPVEGDSTSLAELCALLSDLASLPIKQSLAITSSVDQFGDAQAIGAVNEKIEGFFDICQARGLNSEQGVLIPVANTRHLMLRQDVVDACAEGKLAIYAVNNVDEQKRGGCGRHGAGGHGQLPRCGAVGRTHAPSRWTAVERQRIREWRIETEAGSRKNRATPSLNLTSMPRGATP